MRSHAAALLAALDHPSPDEAAAGLGDKATFKETVAWLEHTKIRHYPADARGPLTSPPDEPAWAAALARYLADLGCPVPGPASTTAPGWDGPAAAAAGEWLAGRAVALVHADVAAQCRAVAGVEAAAAGAALDAAGGHPPTRPAAPPTPAAFPDAGDPAVAAAAAALAAAVRAKVPPAPSTSASSPAAQAAASLGAAASALEGFLLPAAAALGWAPGTPPPPPPADVAAAAGAIADALLPLGLPPGPAGPLADRAAAVARWLHLGRLRSHQTAVDGAIAAAQEFTARPSAGRADVKLGRVGH